MKLPQEEEPITHLVRHGGSSLGVSRQITKVMASETFLTTFLHNFPAPKTLKKPP